MKITTLRSRPLTRRLVALALALVVLATAAWLVLAPRWAAGRLERARRDLATALGAADGTAGSVSAPLPAPAPAPGTGSATETAPGRPDAQVEAARWWIDGARALSVTPEESERLADLTSRKPDDWTLSERDLVTTLARREAEPLAMIERAGSAGANPFAAADEDEVPALAPPILRGARLLLARAGLALEAAPEEAGRSLAALAGGARALQEDPRPLAQRLGTVQEELFLHGASWAVADPQVPPEVLADLREALPAIRAEDRIRSIVADLAPRERDAGDAAPAALWRRFPPGGADLATAEALEALRAIVEASREPGRLLEVAAPRSAVMAELQIPEILDMLLRMQAVEASEVLARVALDRGPERRSGADLDRLRRRLAQLPPDRFSGGRPRVESDDRGRLRVINPTAAGAWKERWGEGAAADRSPPFAWTLPASRS